MKEKRTESKMKEDIKRKERREEVIVRIKKTSKKKI